MEFFQHLLPETPEYLAWLDAALHVVHLSLVFFVLFGAFFRKLVPWHFPVLVIIWISWVGIGAYIGYIGYCPLTDWHWQVKWRQGQVNLPPSYIEYCYTYLSGQDVGDRLMFCITAFTMAAATLFSGWRFFRRKASPNTAQSTSP